MSKRFKQWRRVSRFSWKPDITAAVNNVSFVVQPGEMFGLLGANGCGKSTLIRMLCTLLLPDEGQLRVFGHDVVREATAIRHLIHRVAVEAACFRKLSAWENLVPASRWHGLSPAESRTRLDELVAALNLDPKKVHEPMENLSRGQQQKVAVARALMLRPPLLLLDDPTTGLDPGSRRQVQEFLMGCNEREHISVLITTHDMAEAERLCHRVANMHRGRLVAMGTPRAVCEASRTQTLEDAFLALTGLHPEDEEEG